MAEAGDPPACYATAFGLRWRSAFPLPLFAPALPGGCDVRVEHGLWPVTPIPSTGRRVVVGADRIRVLADDGSVIDILATDHIAVSQPSLAPLCAQFFGGAVAVLMALRGMAPLHASAVAIGGQAVVVCGISGAGKSSFAAALVGHGGDLISDDLSVLTFDAAGRACVLPGRTTMRLFPELVGLLGSDPGLVEPSDGGKLRVRPRHVGGTAPIPIGALVHLDASDSAIPRALATNLLIQNVYRRAAMMRLPGSAARFAMIDALVDQVQLERVVGLMDRNVGAFVGRVRAVADAHGLARVGRGPGSPLR